MTWIKPSFTWMMYRSGWGTKKGQERILGIDIQREGFEWALAHSTLSRFDRSIHPSLEEWTTMLHTSPVRIQWDPERTLNLQALPWRTIQVGLGGVAVGKYIDQWISSIEDITEFCHRIQALVATDRVDDAEAVRPREVAYPVTKEIAMRIGCMR